MSPKELFINNPDRAARHREIAGRMDVRESLVAAFNELCWRLPPADHPNQSWAANARRQGAQELIEIFLTLGAPPVARKPTPAGQLDYNDATSTKPVADTKLRDTSAKQ